jgi:7-cyano-7-deazaguanine synthase
MRALLLSGGIDSIALAYWMRPDIAFTVDYGQLAAKAEIEISTKIASQLNIQHEILIARVDNLGSGDLVGKNPAMVSPSTEWWPFRNQFLATIAGMRGISLGVSEILFGTVKTDQFHADGTKEFYSTLSTLFAYQEGNIIVTTPAIDMTTEELVQTSIIPESILSWAHSCHVGNFACGNCRGCYKHQTVMRNLGYGFY